MIGEMDAKSTAAAMFSDIAHVLTGRAEAKARKKAGLDGLLSKLKRRKQS